MPNVVMLSVVAPTNTHITHFSTHTHTHFNIFTHTHIHTQHLLKLSFTQVSFLISLSHSLCLAMRTCVRVFAYACFTQVSIFSSPLSIGYKSLYPSSSSLSLSPSLSLSLRYKSLFFLCHSFSLSLALWLCVCECVWSLCYTIAYLFSLLVTKASFFLSFPLFLTLSFYSLFLPTATHTHTHTHTHIL